MVPKLFFASDFLFTLLKDLKDPEKLLFMWLLSVDIYWIRIVKTERKHLLIHNELITCESK